jgi:hypothetical protein
MIKPSRGGHVTKRFMSALGVGLLVAAGCGVDRPAGSATGGNGGLGDVGGAGGTGVSAGCQGLGGAGPEGAPVDPADRPHLEGSLELLAGDLGDPAFPPLTDPPVGNGLEIRLPTTRGMAVAGTGLHVAVRGPYRSLVDFNRKPYLVDLFTGQVGPLPAWSGQPTFAGAFASDDGGRLYVASTSCEIYRVESPARAPELLWPGPPTCLDTYMDTPIFSNIGLAVLGGHLYLTDSYSRGVLDLDLETHAGSSLPDTSSLVTPSAMVAGSDGKLYVSADVYLGGNNSERQVFRVDPIVGGTEFFTVGGRYLAADRTGHLFIGNGTSIDRVDLVTGDRVLVAGVPFAASDQFTLEAAEVVLGPLPAKVGRVNGLATTPSGDLIIASGTMENVLLRARFSDTCP